MANPEIEVNIKGFEDLYKSLEQLEDKVVKKYLRKALDQIISSLVPELQSRAPYAKSGLHKMMHTYHIRTSGRGRNKIVYDTPQRRASYTIKHLKDSIEKYGGGGGKFAVRRRIVGNFYARFLEKGTYKMAAQPFVRPVMDGKGSQLLENYCQILAEAISNNKADI